MSYITSKGQIKLKGNSTHESFIHLFFKKNPGKGGSTFIH
jgi:hypothetical protein